MRYCNRTLFELVNADGTIKSYHFVKAEEVKQFHGVKFFNLWKQMIEKANIKPIKDEDYYFADYQQAYWMTKSQIDYV